MFGPRHAASLVLMWPVWCSCQDMPASLVFVPRHAGQPAVCCLVPRHAGQPAARANMLAACSCQDMLPCQDTLVEPRTAAKVTRQAVSLVLVPRHAASLVFVPRHAGQPAVILLTGCSMLASLMFVPRHGKACWPPWCSCQHAGSLLVLVPRHAWCLGTNTRLARMSWHEECS